MKKAVLALLLVCFLLVSPSLALENVSREEVINEASHFTGLSRDTLRLLYEEAPSLFINVGRVVFAVKALHLFATAQDGKPMVELLDRFLDELRFVVLPKPLNTFLTAVGVYKVSLEAIRDYVFIPKLDEAIYQSYRSRRIQD